MNLKRNIMKCQPEVKWFLRGRASNALSSGQKHSDLKSHQNSFMMRELQLRETICNNKLILLPFSYLPWREKPPRLMLAPIVVPPIHQTHVGEYACDQTREALMQSNDLYENWTSKRWDACGDCNQQQIMKNFGWLNGDGINWDTYKNLKYKTVKFDVFVEFQNRSARTIFIEFFDCSEKVQWLYNKTPLFLTNRNGNN